MRRVVILGRGGAGKSVLARQLGEVTGLPVVELDALFWQPGLVATDPARWAECQRRLVQRDVWILDGDLGPYDSDPQIRLRAADTVIVLDFAFLRCAWRTIRQGRERGDYWRWIWAYRRRSLPAVMQAITAAAPDAEVHVLRSPRMVRRFVAQLRQTAA
ncbi:DNA topology modulation protein [Actinoallomurus acanthiterrae]